MPHDATDPVPVVCEIVTSLQSMLTRAVAVFGPAVLAVTTINAGTSFNVIPEVVQCSGTIRAVSGRRGLPVLRGVQRVSEHVAAAHGCAAKVETMAVNYPRYCE